MKKIFAFLFVMVLCFSSLTVFAVNTVEVFAKKTNLLIDNTVLIPIEIKNNTGIMGFKITIEFPVETVDVVSVSRGTVTKDGNFNTNLNVNDGTFDVLWNSDENVLGDGTLFVIGVCALKAFDVENISLSFSQEDTFNELWEDVTFVCKDISISCSKESVVETTTQVLENITSNENTHIEISSEQLIDMVKTTLKQLGYKVLDDVEDKNTFVHKLNENINSITGNKFPTYEKFKDVLRAYNDAYESNYILLVTQLVDVSDVKAAIEDAKEKFKINDFNELDEKTQKKFIKETEKNLRALNSEIPEISKNVDLNTAMTTLKKLDGSLVIVESSDVMDEINNDRNSWITYVLCACTVVVVVLVYIVVKKLKVRRGGLS